MARDALGLPRRPAGAAPTLRAALWREHRAPVISRRLEAPASSFTGRRCEGLTQSFRLFGGRGPAQSEDQERPQISTDRRQVEGNNAALYARCASRVAASMLSLDRKSARGLRPLSWHLRRGLSAAETSSRDLGVLYDGGGILAMCRVEESQLRAIFGAEGATGDLKNGDATICGIA